MTLYLGAWIMLMLFPLITLQDLCHEIGSIYVCNSCWWALVGRVMNEHLLISVVWGDERLLFPWTGRRTQERWCQNNPLLSFHLFSFSSSWICPWSKISLLQKLRAKLFCAAYLNRLLCFWLWLSPSSETEGLNSSSPSCLREPHTGSVLCADDPSCRDWKSVLRSF